MQGYKANEPDWKPQGVIDQSGNRGIGFYNPKGGQPTASPGTSMQSPWDVKAQNQTTPFSQFYSQDRQGYQNYLADTANAKQDAKPEPPGHYMPFSTQSGDTTNVMPFNTQTGAFGKSNTFAGTKGNAPQPKQDPRATELMKAMAKHSADPANANETPEARTAFRMNMIQALKQPSSSAMGPTATGPNGEKVQLVNGQWQPIPASQ